MLLSIWLNLFLPSTLAPRPLKHPGPFQDSGQRNLFSGKVITYLSTRCMIRQLGYHEHDLIGMVPAEIKFAQNSAR